MAERVISSVAKHVQPEHCVSQGFETMFNRFTKRKSYSSFAKI